ncbi:hypothetical protein ACFO25_06305 [Paenactinomyces guangxiensis]|nr:hypothetical protein [Paenactinomyces guangxiensis]
MDITFVGNQVGNCDVGGQEAFVSLFDLCRQKHVKVWAVCA